MTRSPRPRKTVHLSDSLHQHLNSYALAAGAAGVGVLALSQPAKAKIVYTPVHHVIKLGSTYHLDLNHDGITDFKIKFHVGCPISVCISELYAQPVVAGNAVDGKLPPGAFALNRGAKVGPNRPQLYSAANMLVVNTVTSNCSGYWCKPGVHFLGLALKIKGKMHYGWARLNVNVRYVVLTGYAYESIPGKAIVAGNTTGPDEDSAEAFSAIPMPAPIPATLGALALGVPGLTIWRREGVVVAAPERK